MKQWATCLEKETASGKFKVQILGPPEGDIPTKEEMEELCSALVHAAMLLIGVKSQDNWRIPL